MQRSWDRNLLVALSDMQEAPGGLAEVSGVDSLTSWSWSPWSRSEEG